MSASTARVAASPIGGEDRHEQAWRARVAAAAAGAPRSSAVWPDFVLEPGRVVDLDNMVRPAMAGLRDAGAFDRGFPTLQELVTTKALGRAPGLSFPLYGRPIGAPDPGGESVEVVADEVPRDEDRDSKRRWVEAVAAQSDGVLGGPVWVSIETASPNLLVSILKPVVDGLAPVLGRDRTTGHEFSPSDHRGAWLRARRIQSPALRFRLGQLAGPDMG